MQYSYYYKSRYKKTITKKRVCKARQTKYNKIYERTVAIRAFERAGRDNKRERDTT